MKTIASNKKARFDYDISEKLVAGIVLTGAEVKSVKSSHISLKGSFVSVKNGEVYLNNAHISPYKMADNSKYDPARARKLLLHKKEIDKIHGLLESKGASAVPLSVKLDRNLIKVEVGIGRGRKSYSKKELIKKRDQLREAQRELK
ncbi:MAG: SsrA-binding protein SmpB [bacterium]|nr:SsrA-binding protein SmpB [bacterium]